MSLNDDSRPTTPLQANTPTTPSPTQKADQICHRFFIKFLLILVASRSTAIENGPRSGRTDRWYNLETPDTDIHREHMRTYRTISAMNTPPTLTIHVVLTIPELGTNRALVALDGPESRLRIEPTPRAILLETWTLTATAPSGSSASLSSSESDQVSVAAVYKHAISLFRSLYTLCHQLPAAKLYQRYRQWPGVSANLQAFAMDLRLQLDTNILTFDSSPSPSRPIPLSTAVHSFPSLATPLGSLRVMVKYLTRPNFRVDTIESLISSRLFNQDENERIDESVTFTPTVQAHRARDSAASSPGSGVGVRSSRPPISATSRHTRTTSFPAISGTAHLPRLQNDPGVPSSGSDRSSNAPIGVPGMSAGSSPAYPQYRGESLPFATPGSLGRGTPLRSVREGVGVQIPSEGVAFPGSADRPSPSTSISPPSNLSKLQPGASPRGDGTRRPSVTPISAFKSSTIGSSGLNSPSTSLRSIGLSRPPSSLPHTVHEASEGPRAWPTLGSSPPSAVGTLSQTNEPPPFAVSTSAPKSGISAIAALHREAAKLEEQTSQATRTPGTKRYSSSFAHRRAPSAGTPGSSALNTSGETPSKRINSARPGGSPLANVSDLPPERSRPPSVTLLDPTEKEQNISEFLRAIDNAKPLRAGLHDSHSSGSASSSAIGHARRISLAERRQSPLIGKLELPPPSPRSPPARLRELNWREEIEVAAAAEQERDEVRPSSDKGKENLSEKLNDMNNTFRRSVQGLKERSRRAAGRTSEPGSSTEEPQQSNTVPEDNSRGAGPSFRPETVRGRLPLSAPEHVATPGTPASDGSGYAGMVGRLDFDSPDLRTAFSRRQPHLRSGDPSPVTDRRSIDHQSRAVESEQSHIEEREVPPSEEAGRVAKPERTSKYTSILRRDATVKPAESRGSSSSAPSNDSSKTRRAATAWPGSSPQ